MNGMTPLAVLLGAGFASGLLLVWSGWQLPDRSPRRPRHAAVEADRRARLGRAAAAGLPVLVVTRWPVAGIACGLLGWFSAELLGGRAARESGVARTEAIAAWAEMLRDTIAAAHGLEEAIVATAPVAPRPVRREVLALAAALEKEPLPLALPRLADDLAHPIGDLVVASLGAAAGGSTRELAGLLGTLAGSARDEAAMHLRVEAARARMRTAVRVITACTIVTASGIVVLNPSYVAAYSGGLGQAVLALIAGCWGLALWWLARLSRFRPPERFLVAGPAGEVSGR